ncbi:LOW QUALITY PROTEIN: helicase with zinc finger domain 2-like [Pecten maximus]|uniref:LOW QUALITY PROTEIN: helicase with zinc finger domain 2-like n=1 Tax=Pecten maximus TaxID=6579 RepID=UPI00145845FD|nr:LOW QUALITY PROTEIN: helicase with zinc finger domain 2-like [Pecten maximus]
MDSSYDDDWFQKSYFESSCGDNDIDILYQRYLECGLDLNDKYSTPSNGIDSSKIIYSFASSQKTPDSKYIELCKSQPNRYKRCSLEILDVLEAVCTPLDEDHYPPEHIYISGRSKCGQAFNEDIVVVEILENSTSNMPGSSVHRKEGKVMTVVERIRYDEIDNPVFVCTAAEMDRKTMLPACKTVPKIRIRNYRVMRERKNEEKYLIETYNYNELEGSLTFKNFFKITPDKRENLSFLVAFLRWDTDCQYPIGAVIGVVDADSSNALRLAEIQHMIPSFYTEETVRAVDHVLQNEVESGPPSNVDDSFVFTIDKKHTRAMDDGFSIEVIENAEDSEEIVYRVGVHVANVCRLVQKDGPIDLEAKKRCQTNYAGMGARPCHMLPEPLSTYFLSLIQGEPRHVLSLYFEINKDGEVQKYPEPGSVKRCVIIPKKNLCYEEVQDVLLRGDSMNVPGLSEKLKNLFGLATKLRLHRLQDAHYAFPGNALLGTDEDNDIAIHEAHYLVEEFMILTNRAIAHMLKRVYPNHIPLRTHDYPDHQHTSMWLEEQGGIANIIMSLQDRDLPNTDATLEPLIIGFENGMRNGNCRVPIDRRIWKKLLVAYQIMIIELKILLRTDDHHPKQCVALQKWYLFQRKAIYTRFRSQNGNHFGLRIGAYTTGTSPIRKYIDLVIQRLLLASIDSSPNPPYTLKEIDDICVRSNKRMQRGDRFNHQYRAYVQAAHLKASNSIKVSAIVVGLPGQTTVELMILGYNLTEEPFHLRFNLLGMCSQPKLHPTHGKIRKVVAKWNKRIYDKDRISFHDRKEIEKCCFTIDPNGNSVFVRYVDWVSVLSASIDDTSADSEQLRDAFRRMEPQIGNINDTENDGIIYASDVCSEVRRHEYMLKHLCSFQRALEIGQTLTVQIEAQPKHGSLVPNIQLVYVTETVAFCLPHAVDPIGCLSRYTTIPAKLTYRDEADYVRIWTPILEMEEATNIVRNENSPLVKNVPVTFHTKMSGTFTMNSRFCKERNIDLGFYEVSEDDDNGEEDDGVENDEDDVDFRSVVCSDFLCIRFTLPVTNLCKTKEASSTSKHDGKTDIMDNTDTIETYDWVGHGRTTKIRRLGKTVTARYEIGFSLHQSPDIPSIGEYLCTLELLTKSNVHRRAEKTIKKLWDATELAKAIALGRPIPNLDTPYHDAIRRLPRDVSEPTVHIPKNNTMQQVAITAALKSSFSLIQGPPGTGKTFTGIKLIYLFHQLNKMTEETGERRQILYCGPSNKSVDLVAKWMKEKFMNCPKAPHMVRFYSQTYECVDFPVPGRIESSRRSLRNAKPDPYFKENDVAVHHLIRKEHGSYAVELTDKDRKFKNQKYSVTFNDVEAYFKTLSKATVEELERCDVIFCTTAMAANPKLLEATKGRLYQCIIDESGMCTEPETMVPIIATEAKQVVLIGDHKQLQPIIMSRAAKELGLDISLFERYAKRKKHLTMLKQQYRMNPMICSFPSKQFYNEELSTDQTYTSGWLVDRPLKLWKNNSPRDHIPIAFLHVEGTEATLEVSTEEGNEKSKSNLEEAKQVVKIFTHLVEQELVDKANIRILSQYNAQRQRINDKLLGKGYRDVRVDTVVASQGGESDYIILSTVRSMPKVLIEHRPTFGWLLRHLGFITDTHQINVALTRAKKGLIIIGNKHLLRCDKTWENLLKFYEEKGRVFDIFPPP